MCDYSLKHMDSRPAKVDDKLVLSKFRSSTSLGFTAVDKNADQVICVMPGTELAFDDNIIEVTNGMTPFFYKEKMHEHNTARFRQVNLETVHTHHDALELPDGTLISLQRLKTGQTATVLQLPAAPKNEQEAKEQQRLEVVA